MIEELLKNVKQNLILEHSVDDELLKQFITAAIFMRKLSAYRRRIPSRK